jgi:hypothetical protein
MAGLKATNTPMISSTTSSSWGPGIANAIASSAPNHLGRCLRLTVIIALAVRISLRMVMQTAALAAVRAATMAARVGLLSTVIMPLSLPFLNS